MSSSPEPPKITDPNITAANQQTLNTQAGQSSQQGSMVNQVNPYGSSTYTQSGTSANGTPLYTNTVNLSPANQQLLETLQGTQKAAGQQGQALISGANYGAQSPSDVIGNATSGLVKDAMSKQVSYLDPFFSQATDQLDAKLKNQGLNPGEPGYDRAMNALKQSQGQTVTGFESTIEPQMFNQSLQTYQLPAQLGGSLAGLGSPTAPSWLQTPQLSIAPADLTGATASAQAAQEKTYQDQLAQNNAMMSGLFGIPTAILGGMGKAGAFNGLMGAMALA